MLSEFADFYFAPVFYWWSVVHWWIATNTSKFKKVFICFEMFYLKLWNIEICLFQKAGVCIVNILLELLSSHCNLVLRLNLQSCPGPSHEIVLERTTHRCFHTSCIVFLQEDCVGSPGFFSGVSGGPWRFLRATAVSCRWPWLSAVARVLLLSEGLAFWRC